MNILTIFELQAELCRAMGHPVRLRILHSLRDGPKKAGDIALMLSLAQTIVSRHLAVLRNNGVVVTQRQRKDIIYRIANPKIVDICTLMLEVLTEQITLQSKIAKTLAEQD